MIDEQAILTEVKKGLGDFTNNNDETLLMLLKGAIQKLTEAGVSDSVIESDLGKVGLTVIVSDLFNNGGKYELSPAYEVFESALRNATLRKGEGF